MGDDLLLVRNAHRQVAQNVSPAVGPTALMLLCFSQAASNIFYVSNFFSSARRKSWLRISLPSLKRIK
jgi:hypothetical protein